MIIPKEIIRKGAIKFTIVKIILKYTINEFWWFTIFKRTNNHNEIHAKIYIIYERTFDIPFESFILLFINKCIIDSSS